MEKSPMASAFSGPRDAIATHRIRNSLNTSGGAVRRDLRWAVSISRGGACPRTAPSGCSAKSAYHGLRLRARRGGPVRGHPREANVIRSPHLVDVDVDLLRRLVSYEHSTASV